MKQALILQGWYQKPEDNWYPWLKKELENKGYKVFLPDLPTIHTDLIDMEKQLEFLDKLITLDEESLVVGHSIGSVLALRLAEKYKFGKMILVAGWDFNDLTYEHRLFWPKPIDHTKITSSVKEIYCISSDNDPYFTAFTVEDMSKRLKGKFILIKGAGHFLGEKGVTEIPELLNLI